MNDTGRGVNRVPDILIKPGSSDMADTPDTSGSPDMADTISTSGSPDMADAPDTSGMPEPDLPGTPDTPAALVRAARTVFATHGYDGASVREITAAAGANLGAITYHFGSKRELYDRVVGSVVTPLAERIEAVVGRGGPVLERAGAVVEEYFAYLADNPDLPQLMMQELAQTGAPPAAVAAPMKRIHGALTSMMVEGQAAGEVAPGPPLVMSIFVLSVPVHLGIMRRALVTHLGVDLGDRELRARVTAAARDFVIAGLRGGH
jgi:AcrR family transcriptional regulator